MCGICGIFNFSGSREGISENELLAMRDAMEHRGPDGAGIWFSENRAVGLGHRRLSIIDLSEKASQPMCNEDHTLWIVYNGEIYNHEEIKLELIKKGHIFKTDHSDTEVILHSFEEWGINCIDKFRGMFAIALWDSRKKEMWLVRDRIGIKPIYYAQQNGRFAFASEIKAILTNSRIPRKVNEESFFHYLSFLTTPAPDTLFEGIKKIPPASWVKVDQTGKITVNRYWDIYDGVSPLDEKSESDLTHQLLATLRDSIKYRMVSDVPFGVFLSGGIDSSTNAILMSEIMGRSVSSFSVGYQSEEKYNEFYYARKLAELIGADRHEIRLEMKDLMEFVPKLVYHQDEPIADPVCVPLYYVSKLAKDNNVTVCQVGEGSDELFCGYPSWLRYIKMQEYNKLPIPASLKKIGLTLLKSMGKQDSFASEWLRRGISKQQVFWGGAEAFPEALKRKLLSERLKKKFKKLSSYEVIEKFYMRFKEATWDQSALSWMGYLDLNFRLPELLLMRVDKMTMATSLEGRVPFLDHVFVQQAMSISQSAKIKNGRLKHILKEAVKPILPQEFINRKKQGFGVPVAEWILSDLGNYARKKINEFCQRTDYFSQEFIDYLFNRGTGIYIWYILNFVMWHEKFIEGKNV